MKFKMQFPASEYLRVGAGVREQPQVMRREPAAFEAGRRMCARPATAQDSMDIAEWKSARKKGLLPTNKPEHIIEVCQMARTTPSDWCAIAVLQCLDGVAVPMASAILTVMAPDRHTVIDVRSLAALGQPRFMHNRPRPRIKSALYIEYVAWCRSFAVKHRVTLRELDQALWYRGDGTPP